MSSRRHQKGRISADSLYKPEFLCYIVFSCLPIGTGRVVSVHLNKCYSIAKVSIFVGKWEYYRGCTSMTGGVNTSMHVYWRIN